MADDDAKVSFPYMTAAQWFGVRAKLRQSVPKAIDVDWVMSALGTSEKGARNILPQLRAIGLINKDGTPSDLALELRDDETYQVAAKGVLEALYPQSLRDSYDDPSVEFSRVSSWFMRNAKTGEMTANMQAKLYLTLLKGELPGPEDAKPATPRKKADSTTATRPAVRKPKAEIKEPDAPPAVGEEGDGSGETNRRHTGDKGPALYLDLQIHISADAGTDQIDAIFQSMAKHIYGR